MSPKLLFLSSLLLLSTACGSSDDATEPPDTSAGGSASGGTGGSVNAGAGGSTSAGSGGTTAGSGGSSAGAGGQAAGSGGVAGAGGQAGKGGGQAAGAGGSTAGAGGGGDAGAQAAGAGGSAAGAGGDAGAGGGGGLPSASAKLVSVGRLHSCAVLTSGAVRCWGSVDRGQLGNGVIDSSQAFAAPVQVKGLTGVTAISSLGDHTCVLASGGVQCWGGNDEGQLGNGATTDSAVPVPVSGLAAGMVAVAAGEMHACALTAGGGVKCWGKNDYGQLGNGTDDAHSLTPVGVTGLDSGVTAIASGRYHSCAVLTSGAVKCWGGNLYGEQGIGADGNGAHVPGDVMGLSSGVVGVSGGDSTTCARLATGALKCWGRGSDGELGDGQSGFNVDKYLPTDVVSISAGTTVVSNGYGYTCAVVAGGAKCWGSNTNYVIGNGQDASFLSAVPVDVKGLTSGVVDLAASSTEHTCAVTAAGAVFCWGAASANLGNGDTSTDALAPVAVLGLP